jgi:hypothetical protein
MSSTRERHMNTKAYVAMAALAAMALMVGAFVLPATVAYADSAQVKTNIHNNQKCSNKGGDFSTNNCSNSIGIQ